MNTNSSRVDRKLKTKFIASAAACCGMPVRKCVLFCFARSAEWYWFCGFRFNARFHFRHFSCLNASYSGQRNIATLLTVHLCFCGGVWTHSSEWQQTQINSRCMHLSKWKMNLLGGDAQAEWNGLHQTNLEEISCFIRDYPWFECILSGVCLGLSEFIQWLSFTSRRDRHIEYWLSRYYLTLSGFIRIQLELSVFIHQKGWISLLLFSSIDLIFILLILSQLIYPWLSEIFHKFIR